MEDLMNYAVKRCYKTFCDFEVEYYIQDCLDWIESQYIAGLSVWESDVDEWIAVEVARAKGHDVNDDEIPWWLDEDDE